ncbi:T6SS amidase immunity protein Tai4 family protein [Pluralibacter gergoviae]|uniref:T6SS amidase immunity protein Tai4 family protein n=1 Tax=Pluralibacter gergoviae TaxID=61647 RepID=UPI000907E0DF|nr:T6SS amidase immunity protein Tai4 family protein [Pluralibacter gergoviae]ELN2737643.1 hypothetical protein [Pluralibacter gergoviae]
MKKLIAGFLLLLIAASVNAAEDPTRYIKEMTYRQLVKDAVLARCIAKVSEPNSQFSIDAARSGNSLLTWVPFNIENGNDKINSIINKYKVIVNNFHAERKPEVKGVTLNCLQLYHSAELNNLVPQLIDGNPDRTWYQDNPQ